MSKKKRKYSPLDLYVHIFRFLEQKEYQTPHSIAEWLYCDIRTIKKQLQTLESLGMLIGKEISTGKKMNVKVYKISDEYLPIWNSIRKNFFS